MTLKKAPAPRSAAAQASAAQASRRRQEALGLLSALDCLRGLPAAELGRLIDLGAFRVFPAGATVFGQQRQAQFLFLVLQGSLQLRLRDRDGREVLMGFLSRGDCCGEGPLFGDFFRRMSALTQSDCQLLQIPLADLREALPTMPLLATALRQVYKRRLVDCTLARVPLLGQLLPVDRLTLAGQLCPAHFPRGGLIMEQGSPADSLYLIESGQVVVEQNGQTIASLGEGDFFGEIALLTSQPHRAAVRALTPTDLLILPGAQFHRLIAARPDLEEQLRAVVEQRIRNGAEMRGDSVRNRELVLAVNRGLLRATHLLVRTPALCPPDCRICVDACARRHGHPRLALNGTPIDSFDVLDACRQCSVGPECVEACPEDAIERTEEGTLRITDACTGCGACVSACPYGAVASVPIAAARPAGPLWSLLQRARRRLRPDLSIPLAPARPTHRAQKCDLCHGFADMACVSACPTGSLKLMAIEDVFPL